MEIRSVGVTVVQRWSAAVRDVLAATLAGGLAWLAARMVLGHPHPVFAAIVAIVCLAPGLPSHTRQALGLLIGVGIGIAIGELALLFPGDIPLIRGSVGVFVAMMIASSFALGPAVPIQAAVSALLVFVLGPQTAGSGRMLDSAAGVVVALIVSQILLTPDPVVVVEKAARGMLRELSSGFSLCDTALVRADWNIAQAAMKKVSAAHANLVAFDSSIDWARHAACWSLRGRLAASEVNDVVARYDHRAARPYGSTLLFSETLADALRNGEAPPPWLRERVQRVAELYGAIAAGKAPAQKPPLAAISVGPALQSWQSCITHLLATEAALRAFPTTSGPLTENANRSDM